MTRGLDFAGRQPALRVAEERDQFVADDLDDLLGRRQAAQHVLADRALAHAIDERLDDLEVDVGLEQRHADLAQRRLDDRLRQPRLAAQRAEHVLEPLLSESNIRYSRAAPGCRPDRGRPPASGRHPAGAASRPMAQTLMVASVAPNCQRARAGSRPIVRRWPSLSFFVFR